LINKLSLHGKHIEGSYKYARVLSRIPKGIT